MALGFRILKFFSNGTKQTSIQTMIDASGSNDPSNAIVAALL